MNTRGGCNLHRTQRMSNAHTIVLAALISLAAAVLAVPIWSTPPSDRKEAELERRLKALRMEMTGPYPAWLQREVPYIITEQEVTAFKKLTTDEEREQFIANFWDRRNPEPGNPENKFMQEYYRRIIFANQHFSTNIRGWRTDRGRIYIQFGPPDSIDANPTGATAIRSADPAHAELLTVPTEIWHYRYVGASRANVEMVFADPAKTGDYHLIADSGAKEVLLRSPKPERGNEFTANPQNTLQPFDAAPSSSSTPRSTNLRAILASNLVPPNPLPMLVRPYSIHGSDETDLVVLAIQVSNCDLQFERQNEAMRGTIDLYGQVVSIGGRVVHEMERSLTVDLPQNESTRSADGTSTFVESLPLHPGRYKLRVALQDNASGSEGKLELGLVSTMFTDLRLASDPVILGSSYEPQAGQGDSTFTIGGDKVLPRPAGLFSSQEELRAYLQVYNLAVDPATLKASLRVQYEVWKGGRLILSEPGDPSQLARATLQATLDKKIPLRSLLPGPYTLKVRITDNIQGQTITPSSAFSIR